MKLHTKLLAPVVLGALAVSAPAQEVGTTVSGVELEAFAQTGAESFDDLMGRAVLIEFFAYW